MLKRSCKNTLKKKDEPAGRPETNDLVLLLSSELLIRLSPHLSNAEAEIKRVNVGHKLGNVAKLSQNN